MREQFRPEGLGFGLAEIAEDAGGSHFAGRGSDLRELLDAQACCLGSSGWMSSPAHRAANRGYLASRGALAAGRHLPRQVAAGCALLARGCGD